MRKTIALISIYRETIIGGVSAHSSNLYERLQREGVPVEKINYAPFFVTGSRWSKAVLLLKIALRLTALRLSGTRIFHFHASNRALIYHLFAPFIYLTGGKMILSIHSGYGFDRWLHEHRFYDRLNRISFRPLRWLIFMNRDESDKIGHRYYWMAPRVRKVNPYIAPPGVSAADFAHVARPDAPFIISTVGVWEKRYNVEEAVAAAVRFQRMTGVPTRLLVLMSTVRDDAAYHAALEARIETARATIEVELLEDRDDVLYQLARSHVSLRPALYDSYGLCVAESLLVGTPAIATDVCPRCRRALLYRVGDMEKLHEHLLTVYRNPPEERISLLDPAEDSYNQYVGIYRDLLSHDPRKPAIRKRWGRPIGTEEGN